MEVFALNQILSWSPTAISTLILFILVFLIRKMIRNEKAQIKQTNNLHICIKKDLADIRTDSAKALDEIKSNTTKTLEEHSRRISNLELEYVRRDTFYRELGGWKDDINGLSGRFSEFTRNIIELWKSKGT